MFRCVHATSRGTSKRSGRSLTLNDTMQCAPPRIAAARTCRLSGSGTSSPAHIGSHPTTRASSNVNPWRPHGRAGSVTP